MNYLLDHAYSITVEFQDTPAILTGNPSIIGALKCSSTFWARNIGCIVIVQQRVSSTAQTFIAIKLFVIVSTD